MDAEALKKFLAQNAEMQKDRIRPITFRRYNLVIHKRDGEIEIDEFLTLKRARELKAEYLRESGFRCDIIEDYSEDTNGKEINPQPRPDFPEIKGRGGFGTPEATKRRIENDRRKGHEKAMKIAHAMQSKPSRWGSKSKEMNYAGMIGIGADPKSNLHQNFLDGIKDFGYTVTDKHRGITVVGFQKDISNWIFEFLKSGGKKTDLDIIFNGATK